MMVFVGLNGCLAVWYIFYDLTGFFGWFLMGLIKREGLFGRVALGIIAGVVTIVFFSLDQLEVLAPLHKGNAAFNYSIIIISLYLQFVMHIIAGLKREYEVSLTYVVLLAAYDLLTDGLVTMMFAILSFISLVIGLVASGLARWLGLTGND